MSDEFEDAMREQELVKEKKVCLCANCNRQIQEGTPRMSCPSGETVSYCTTGCQDRHKQLVENW